MRYDNKSKRMPILTTIMFLFLLKGCAKSVFFFQKLYLKNNLLWHHFLKICHVLYAYSKPYNPIFL